jgi:2'-phosphotransferase
MVPLKNRFVKNMEKDLDRLSRTLVWLLRHGAVRNRIPISSNGYVSLERVFKMNQFLNYTLNDVQYVVDNNDKKRFDLKQENGKYYIRANQGHSCEVASKIDQEKIFTKLTEPLRDIVSHGTSYEKYDSIKISGLKRKKRSHIYFAVLDDFVPGCEDEKIRHNTEVLIFLNMKLAMSDGIEFYISQNNVVQSQGVGAEGLIDKKYFNMVVDRKTGQLVR